MQLSQNFTLRELTLSQYASRLNLSNEPDQQALMNLQRLCVSLDRVRNLAGVPIHVSSGYRSLAVNRAVGGSQSSAHCAGLAADINAHGMHAYELAQLIYRSDIQYDQLIYEGEWVHFGLRAAALRNQVLTAKFGRLNGTKYLPGLVRNP